MPEQNQKQQDKEFSKRPNIFLRVIYALLFLLIISLVIWRFFFYKSVQEQFAAIEASRTIPDSENAAIIYNQLIENYNVSDLNPVFSAQDVHNITISRPWTSHEYPEVAKWLEDNNEILEKIIQASKYEKCIFPIAISSPKDMDIISTRLYTFQHLSYWIFRSANNDFGEGRTDQALEKYICCILMGRHFRQQPIATIFLIGISMETNGLQKVRYLIMNEDITEEQTKTIETTLPETNFQFDEYWKNMLKVENLYSKILPKITTYTNLLGRLKELWTQRNIDEAALIRVKEIYLRLLADRQGTQILIGLRQYKKKTGKWPEILDEIKPYLTSEDILVDPQNNGSFVYKLKDNSFILYSTGLNGIDENGQKKAPADDWPIWPLPQTQTQTNKMTQNDPNME
jgi:hypothetical protein